MLELLLEWLPASLWLLSGVIFMAIGHVWLGRSKVNTGAESRLPWQLFVTLVLVVAVLGFVIAMPIPEGLRGQILSLVGVVLTGVIGLSSTTFVTNAIAGILLRSIEQFKPGDFIHVNDQFGRVTERGLFHVEIQTEDRDLTTFPNLYLVTNPITVVHKTGTIVSATVSLGYEVHHSKIERALVRAAASTGLSEPFVQIKDLGDYSVVYRIAGFLEEVKPLLTVRSLLRREMLDALHSAGIEIVSPAYMNQRPQADDSRAVPTPQLKKAENAAAATPEQVMFEKADKAEQLEAMKLALAEKNSALAAAKQEGSDKRLRTTLSREIEEISQQIQELDAGDDKPDEESV